VTPDYWRGRRVLLTGHTGFWGSWCLLALERLGARVCGYALPPISDEGLFAKALLAQRCEHVVSDVADTVRFAQVIADFRPEVVFHLAAQALVVPAYEVPEETFRTNVLGTVNVLEAATRSDDVHSVIVVTTDKVYDPERSPGPFVESDALGGRDPYATSKVGAELAVAAYRSVLAARDRVHPRLVSVRAGNIFGGGDWSPHRIVPDAVRAFRSGNPLTIRNPAHRRPWQHVLDAVHGLLLLGEAVNEGRLAADEVAFNFGPPADRCVPVSDFVELVRRAWPGATRVVEAPSESPVKENPRLLLDSARAESRLGWRCRFDLERAVAATVAWYRSLGEAPAAVLRTSMAQLDEHGGFQ
jgi:CDP-glucose 4,6-dehydratase